MKNLLVALILASFSPAHAATLRCQGWIIDGGKDEAEFLKLCGEPLHSQEFQEKFVSYEKDAQSFETKTKRQFLVDDGSSSYIFLVTTNTEKVEKVSQTYIERPFSVEKCKDIPFGSRRIVFDRFCGSPSGGASQREVIPTDNKTKQPQIVRAIEEVIYNWGTERWKLTFANNSLTLRKKL